SALRLTRNTFMNWVPVSLFLNSEKPGEKFLGAKPSIRLESSANVFDVTVGMSLNLHKDQMDLSPAESHALLRRLVSWKERGSVYRPDTAWLSVPIGWDPKLSPSIKSLKDWQQFWGLDGGSLAQGRIQYERGEIRARAARDTIPAADFRLHKDSAGKGK